MVVNSFTHQRYASPYVGQHTNNVLLDGPDVGFDLFPRKGESGVVEEAVEVDLIARVAHPAVVLGNEEAGAVERVGENVKSVKPGDHIDG